MRSGTHYNYVCTLVKYIMYACIMYTKLSCVLYFSLRDITMKVARKKHLNHLMQH